MGPLGWTFLLLCLGRSTIVSKSSTCSHAQCDYDYVTRKADCTSLNLDCIPVNYPDALIMDLSHNNISDLTPDDFNGTFSWLAELYLDYNDIADVTSLLGSNTMGNLRKLSVNHNVISYLPSTCQLGSVTDLEFNNNLITYLSTIPRCFRLQRFSADYNFIQSINMDLSSTVIDISLKFNKLFYVRLFGYGYVNGRISLYLEHNEIRNLFMDNSFRYVTLDIVSLNHNRLLHVHPYVIPNTFNIGSNGLQNWNKFDLYLYRGRMKRLDISNNSFDALIQPFWAEGLEVLNANTNLLTNLSPATLSGFVDVTELHVANNRLLFISSTALSQLSMLQSLYLDHNTLTSLFGGVFFNQSNLVELSITNNLLTMLHPDYFIGLVSLERLYLAGNQLTTVSSQMFQLMHGILTIDLSKNKLQFVNLEDCSHNLTNLQNFSLAHNVIRDTDPVLGLCDNLQVLDLRYNMIAIIPSDSLSGGNGELSKLELEGNPLQCDCRLTGLRDWLRNNPPDVEPRCKGPKQHYGSVVTDLDQSDMYCQPPRTTTTDKDVTVVSGQTTTLECTASGIPAPTITWLHPDGTEISHEWQGRFAILQGRILLITPMENSDQGIYTCLAQNVLGEMDRSTVNVTVANTSSHTAPMPSQTPSSQPFSLQLGVSDIPKICITFALTCSVAALILLFRWLYNRRHKGVISKHGRKTSRLKVGFRRDRATGLEGVYVNQIINEDCKAMTDNQVVRNRYMTDCGRGNPQCQTDGTTYENVNGGSETGDGDTYEILAVPSR